MKNKNDGYVNFQLEPDEALVVLEKRFWDHLVTWYTIMANECTNPDEKANWVSIIQAVQSWVGQTHYTPGPVAPVSVSEDFDDDDGWN